MPLREGDSAFLSGELEPNLPQRVLRSSPTHQRFDERRGTWREFQHPMPGIGTARLHDTATRFENAHARSVTVNSNAADFGPVPWLVLSTLSNHL
jgi:hypothetical protein